MDVKKLLETSLIGATNSSLPYDKEYAEKILQPLLISSVETKELNFQQTKGLLGDNPYKWKTSADILNLVSKKIFFNKEEKRISFVIPKPKTKPNYLNELFSPLIRFSNSGTIVAFYTPTIIVWIPTDLYWIFTSEVTINFLFSDFGSIKSGASVSLQDGLIENFNYFINWCDQLNQSEPIFNEEIFKLPCIVIKQQKDDKEIVSYLNRPLTKSQFLEIKYWDGHLNIFERITRQFYHPSFRKVLSLINDHLIKKQDEKWQYLIEKLKLFLDVSNNKHPITHYYDNFILKPENSGYLYFGIYDLGKTNELTEIENINPEELESVIYQLRTLAIFAHSNVQLTKMGKHFPFFIGANFEYLDLLNICPEKPEKYWEVENDGFWWLNEIIEENEIPLKTENLFLGFEDNEIAKYNSDELKTTYELLFEEASALKEFFIPPNAFVDVKVGPFVGVRVYEKKDDVILKWITENNEFFIMSMWPTEKSFSFQTFGELKFLQEEGEKIYGSNDSILISNASYQSKPIDKLIASKQLLGLISATIIRDFWVVEDRKEVFYVREQSKEPSNKKKKNRTSKRVIYIPRRRYSNKIDLSRFQKSLNLSERSKHIVRQHYRKGSPTPAQAQLAKLMSINLPDGYTFVKTHYRGGGETQKIYRSISAISLASSINSKVISDKNELPTWFDFENEVRKIQELMGYEILFQAPNYTGDGGVDLRVRKKTSNKLEEVIIQCKCWKNTVGPDVVREMIGTLIDNQTDGVNLRGSIYTTSKFSQEAVALATKHGIELVDGQRWGQISNQLLH